ncbi:MAG: GNAT family N-acetyltransferase [Lentisphaerae bacterium]|nr:GNAT family N-acetyltransferase [Lentisphaerota bacterium]
MSGVPVLIRKVADPDTGEVKNLVHGIMREEFSAESKAYSAFDLDNPCSYYGGSKDMFLVAEKDRHIVGTVAIKEDAPDSALLRRIFVKKEYRGKGLGEQLLCKALEFCFEHNYRSVVFRGTDRMQGALKLCLKNGFVEEDLLVAEDIKIFVLTKKLSRTAQVAAR